MSSSALEFGAIDGLDTASGLRFFAGHAPRYLQGLQTFATIYRHGLPLDGAAAGVAGLQQALHALAGASLVLGATALGSLAQRVEARLATVLALGDALQAAAPVQLALAALVQQLDERLPPR